VTAYRFLGDVEHRYLPILNNAAALVVFPSYCEACPIIVIESMGCEPVCGLRHSVLREICGEAVAYFDPFNAEAMARRFMRWLWTSAEDRSSAGAPVRKRTRIHGRQLRGRHWRC